MNSLYRFGLLAGVLRPWILRLMKERRPFGLTSRLINRFLTPYFQSLSNTDLLFLAIVTFFPPESPIEVGRHIALQATGAFL